MVKLSALGALAGLASVTFAEMRGTALGRNFRRSTISGRKLVARADTERALYPEYNLSVPIDHFHNDSLYEPHSDGKFNLRYWFDASYYEPGGPVIVLQAGETSGAGRLTFLQKGLIHQLAIATHGIAVVLEHRYYGTSIPVDDFSTQNLRFLTTDQALADQAYFSQNVVFAGLEDHDLTAPNTAHIAYGGSYAGSFVAFLRKLYPETYWGAISSSGVPAAIWDYWTYFEPVRYFADPTCVSYTQKITHAIDNILIGLNDTKTTAKLKAAFGLQNVTHDNDFANVVSWGIGGWQGKNWDPELNSPDFDLYCGNITAESIIWPKTNHQNLKNSVQDLLKKGGYSHEVSTLTTPLLNWIGWLGDYTVDGCENQDACYNTHNKSRYSEVDISQDGRLWEYQYCTQWGYIQTGSGVPKHQLPLVSRTQDLEYLTITCRESFNRTEPADVEAINKYGSFGLSYPRLAWLDGEQDPWRPAGAHASPFNTTAKNRTSTISEPFILIDGAVHHWDENGLFPNETIPGVLPPPAVDAAQAEVVLFVKEWLREWDQRGLVKQG